MLRYVTLRYVTLHDVMQRYVTLHYVTLRYVTLRYVTLRYITLCYVTLCYVTLRCYITLYYVKPTIHDATGNMQLAACNRIALCVLEMLCVACSVKLFHANRIVVYSLQHVTQSFKGFTGNATTEHLSRHGDYSTPWQVWVYTKMNAFSWTVAKIDALQVRRRRSCRYGEQRTFLYRCGVALLLL